MAQAYVFDLDGTLTVAVHDFAAMRRALGLPVDMSLLEGLETMTSAARQDALARIEQWEWEHAELARPAPGAEALLQALSEAGVHLGILTRNLAPIALRTLAVAGLDRWFAPADVLGRTCATPKPAGDGVRLLLARWSVSPEQAVMVGDFVHDAQAGRAAGARTILVRGDVPAAWASWCDAHHVDLHGVLRAWQQP